MLKKGRTEPLLSKQGLSEKGKGNTLLRSRASDREEIFNNNLILFFFKHEKVKNEPEEPN